MSNPVGRGGCTQNWRVTLSFSGTGQFTPKWKWWERSEYKGGDIRFGVSPLSDLLEFPVLSKIQNWTRTPRDASGFLPLKLKLDATSKLLSCPFFIYFIYMALNAKAFSFAHSHCDHQSKGWVLLHWKNTNKIINQDTAFNKTPSVI